MGGKAEPRSVAVVVTIDALAARVAALEAQVGAATAELEIARQLQHLVGHEVRTPLTVILGVLATLQHPDLASEERRRLEARALAHAQHLREVVDDLMAGDSPVWAALPRAPLETMPLAPLLRAACAAVSGRAIALDVPAGHRIATAPARLSTIVTSLLDNAVRHGGGAITVTGRCRDHEVEIAVADAGPGLRGADPEALFAAVPTGAERDRTAEVRTGLYLARLLSRSLGGDLTLEDGAAGGLVARVRLPQRRSDDPLALSDHAVPPVSTPVRSATPATMTAATRR